MPPPPSTFRLALAGCTGLLLLGGIAGAATIGGSTDQAKPASVLAPNDTVPEAGATTSIVPGGPEAGLPVPVAPGAATTATTTGAVAPAGAAPGSTATTARPGRVTTPGPLVPPKLGDYAYDATSTSPSGTRTQRTTTKVEAAGTEGATTLQTVTVPLDFGGQQAVARSTVAWGTGAVVRRSVITINLGSPQQLDCTWQPPFAQYDGPLAVGKTWSFDTRCAGKVQGLDVAIHQQATRRVTAAAQVTGPAGPVPTWTIADDTTLMVTSPLGAGTVHMVGTSSLAPSIGLPLRTEATVDASRAGTPPEHSTLRTTLVSQP